MLPGPVFNAELLTTARRTRYYAVRLAYGVILLFFIWQNHPRHGAWGSRPDPAGMTIQEMARLGWALFFTFLMVQSVAILLLTPTLVAGVIADEKQRKTLHYLLASRLTSGEIILGKLAARMLHLGVFVAIGLPIMSLLSLFGGVDPVVVLLSFAATITTAFFLSALSILVSTHARRPREAISLVYVLEACWLFGPSFLALTMPLAGPRWARVYQWIKPVNDWIAPTSPFNVFSAFGRFGVPNANFILEFFSWMMGLQTAYGILFVLIAVWQLRRVNRRDGGGSTAAWLEGLRRGRRLLPRPECGDDAMLWKECYVSRTSLAMKLATIVLGFGVLCGLGYLTYDFAKPAFVEVGSYGYGEFGTSSARVEFNGYLRFVCTVTYVLITIAIASSASSGLTSEREEDTWISLVATPLDGLEIVRAKMIGAVWGQRWVVGALVLLWGLGLAAGSIHPVGVVAVAVETAVFLWFATALGTYYSLRSKTTAWALVATMGTLIVLNGAYLMCCLPLHPDGPFIALGVTPALEAFSLASFDDIRSLLLNGSHRRQVEVREMVAVTILGTVAYAVAASVLTYRAVVRFDEEAGRARRDGAIPPSKPIAFDDAVGDEFVDLKDKTPRLAAQAGRPGEPRRAGLEERLAEEE